MTTSRLFRTAAALLLVPCQLIPSAKAQSYGLPARPNVNAFYDGVFPTEAPSIPANWSTVVAFPNLSFQGAVGLTSIPGTNKLLVWEREGKIWVFDNDPATSTKTLVVDLSANVQGWDDSGLLAVAPHPDFANNHQIYVWYNWRGGVAGATDDTGPVIGNATTRPPTNTPTRDRLARFVLDSNFQTPKASEYVVIDQRDHTVWHNGGGMFFHPTNGFLYITNGDDQEGGTNAQRIDLSLFSGVLRIDVDMRGGSISHAPTKRAAGEVSPGWPRYYVPNDNPFVGQTNALEEFFAIGLRSPHRMTHDPVTNRIFIGDVGQESYEEVTIIEPTDPPGLNLQWNKIEGLHGDLTGTYIGVNKRPVIDYPHSGGDGSTCVVGGYVYRGTEFPELYGKYIFGDNISGFIWYLDETTTPATKVRLAQLPRGQGVNSGNDYLGLSSFGLDANKELYICQMGTTSGKIYKLQRGGPAPGTPLPATLSATGLFSNLATMTPSPKLIPYELNAPFWSDGAIKTRWATVPNSTTVGFAPSGEWTFPAGSVLVKHFDLANSDVDPNSRRHLETRVIVKKNDGSVYGATYKWRTDQTDADLLDGALTESIPIATAPVGTFTGQDIGGPTLAGSTTRDGDAVTIVAGGDDIWGTTDKFHFASQLRTGDFDIAVQVESVVQADLYTKTGLMVRESLAANAKHVMALVFPSNAARNNNVGGYEFQYRATTGGGAVALYPALPQPTVNYPNTWLRMKREGDTFIAYNSSDGFNWTEYQRTTVDMPDQIYFGMAVTAHVAAQNATTTAKFRLNSRRQPWYYPSRQDCVRCHNDQAGGVLGPSTRQLNKDMLFSGSGVTDNQIRSWNHVGLFSNPPQEADIPAMQKLSYHTDTSASLMERARSYLDANCSYCHRPGGVQALWDGRYQTPFEQQGLYYGLVNDNLGNPNGRVIVPQDINDSILHTRINKVGDHQMPPLARNMVDSGGVEMIRQWINSLQPEVVVPPTTLAANAISQNEVALTWADQSDNEVGFVIERSLDNLAFEQVGIVATGVTNYTDNTVDPYSTVYYRVAAFGPHIYSAYTNVASATTDTGTPASEIRITGNGRVILNNDITPNLMDGTDFGTAVSSSGQIVKTFTIESLGDAPLQLSGTPIVKLQGTGAGSFSVIAQPPSSTLPGPGGVSFQIRFQPTSTGTKSAAVVILSNDPSEATTSFTITGNSVTSNLAGWWKLDEGTGTTTADSSGNGLTASLDRQNNQSQRPVWTTSGKWSNALNFTGVANQALRVTSATPLNPTQGITVAAWVKAIDWNGNRRVVQKGDGDNQYRLLAETGKFAWDISGIGRLETALPPVNQWFHVIGSYDGAQMRLYINGELVANAAESGALQTTTDALNIGTKTITSTAGDHMNGTIDDVRIYQRGLSDAEATMLGTQDGYVTIAATDSIAQKGTTNTATFTVTRTGSTAKDLPVGLNLTYGTGQALPRVDFSASPQPLDFVIPAGQSSATIVITALDRQLPTGTLQLSYSLVDSPGYLAGVPSSAQIQIQDSPLNLWKISNFGSLAAAQAANADDDADSDGDGLTTLLEAALGGSPNARDTARLPDEEVEIIGGQLYLTSTYVRPKPALSGISFHHRTSFDLSDGSWNEAVILPGYPQDNGNGTETVKIRSLVPIVDQATQFLRLEITRP